MNDQNIPNGPINDQKRKWKPYLIRFIRAVRMYAIFVGIFNLTAFCFRFTGEWGLEIVVDTMERTLAIGCCLIFVLTLNTTLRNFARFDRFEQAKFLNEVKEKERFFSKADIREVLHSYKFWVELLSFAAFLIFWPLEWKINSIPIAILGKMPASEFVARLIIFAVAMPIVFGLNLFAYMSAHQYWWKKRGDRNNKVASESKLIKRSFLAAFCYSFGFFLLPLLISTILWVIPILWTRRVRNVIFVLLGIIFGIVTFTYLRALWQRRRFINCLKRLCNDNHFELSKIKYPYFSLFRTAEDANFTVSAFDKIYECRLLGSVKRSNAMRLSPDGICSHSFAFVLRRVEFFRIERSTDYRFESRYSKVLIITPVPKKLLSTSGHVTFELDNGDRIGEYTVFSGGGFLRALERDCVERLVKS